tara:strand:- start:3091 stop:3753 length:663 start_codon:yes stop_codon:yes gene_type:complete
MKVISFSLWGQDPKYLIGAIRNAELAKEIYPDWVCRFYIGQSVPSQAVLQLERHDNVQIVERLEFGDWRGMFWRFLPASEDSVDVMISRDTDSRLSIREKMAVDEWLESDKKMHIMRDHPHHGYPILGGMWGAKSGAISNIKNLIDNFAQEDAYGTDYKFFAELIFPTLTPDQVMTHDEFFDGQPFPSRRQGLEFVGQVFDENEKTIIEHQNALRRYYDK